ncbi:hypothetical protein [Acinetobacter brisouii]|uniref:hypothetical protein n=1 Tax=Acinetobacter brisouii TaxID=396323 RepID=UPI00124D7237|nr:hypothetical protein [Acinetobacter brisouii]
MIESKQTPQVKPPTKRHIDMLIVAIGALIFSVLVGLSLEPQKAHAYMAYHAPAYHAPVAYRAPIYHAPVYHAPVYHAPVYHAVTYHPAALPRPSYCRHGVFRSKCFYH